MQPQAIYEIDLDNEASGTVHHFCTTNCLLSFAIKSTEIIEIEDQDHVLDGEQCAQCGEDLESTPNTQEKFEYFNQCDRWRIRYENGEDYWHEMMASKIRVSQTAFEEMVNLEDLLDEDESLSEFIADDPDHAFSTSVVDGEVILFIEHSGFEFIFTSNGEAPKEDVLKNEFK